MSFKPKHEKTDHSKDVELLREVVLQPGSFPAAVTAPIELIRDDSDKIQSAFTIMGLDCGVPPVIKR